MLDEILTDIVIDDIFDHSLHIAVTEFSLRLSLELWLRDLDGDDGIESIRHILHREFAYLFVKFICLLDHLVDTSEESSLEADHMCTTIFGGDIVDE